MDHLIQKRHSTMNRKPRLWSNLIKKKNRIPSKCNSLRSSGMLETQTHLTETKAKIIKTRLHKVPLIITKTIRQIRRRTRCSASTSMMESLTITVGLRLHWSSKITLKIKSLLIMILISHKHLKVLKSIRMSIRNQRIILRQGSLTLRC